MALQSSFYPVDGRSRTYPQTKPIPTKQHASVYSRLVGTNDWVRLDNESWNLINNSIVLREAFSPTVYDQIEVRIADKPDELTDSISDIATVAGLSTEIVSLTSIKAKLESLYADKAKLDSLFADKATLDSLYADKTKLDSLFADKTKLDSLFADKATLDSLFADKATLDGLFSSKTAIDSLYIDKATLDSLYADKGSLDAIYANLVELLNVDTLAAQVAADRTAIETIYDNFDDRYLGAFASDPTLDNDGNTLLIGAVYFNTTDNETKFYNGAVWEAPEATATLAASQAQTAQAAAEAAQAAAELAYDNFDDRYLGAKASNPTLDNDGNPLITGAIYWNTTTNEMRTYDGALWNPLGGGGATGGGADKVFMENDQVITTSYTIASGKNAITAGDITINDGVTVTVPDGSRWVIA